jgi:hypothetical protein
VKVVRLQHCAHLPRRLLELAVAAAEDERLARARLGQPEQQAQGRRLASAVGPEIACHRAPLERERYVVDGDNLAVALTQ